MMYKSKIIFSMFTFFLIFYLSACDDQTHEKKTVASTVISGEIIQPVVQSQPLKPEKEKQTNQEIIPLAEMKREDQAQEQEVDQNKGERYDSKGKIDPFKPLIQEKPEEAVSPIDDKPKRILTPLEKIELSQIRLVAVIILKNRQIAMVEEANGKGYEIGIGTYIGQNQGRVSEINSNSIMVTELIRDYKGKLKEHVQEIKLHKIDNEE